MPTADYFRVRRDEQSWTDKGPDLLRRRENAKARLRAVIGMHHDRLFTRKKTKEGDFTAWRGPMRKQDVMEAFDAWGEKTISFQVGRGGNQQDVKILAVVKQEDVKLDMLPDCSAATSLAHSLVQHQYPEVNFCGGYNYRQIAGSDSWSDHAWGTAIDNCQDPPKAVNDEVLDWVARMGSSRNMLYDYAIGSRNGVVVAATAPDFDVHEANAADSHLTHVHISITDHDGRRPPRAGGVFSVAVDWQGARLIIAVIAGTFTLVAGVLKNEPAMMTVGAGLIGFSPAAKGP